MKNKRLSNWFSIVSVILILWGIVFAFFGLGILPVQKEILLEWESALYGAIMIGWGITLLFAGRHAFRKNDRELMQIILYGLFAWLLIEGLFSVYLGVWFNVIVVVGVFTLFSIPLIKALRSPSEFPNL